MLLRIDNRLRYTKAHKRIIRKLRPFPGGTWDNTSSTTKALKKHIRIVLSNYQENKCAYCSQPLKVTSGSEIEHIAPKGGKVYPKYTEFTFTPYNLVLSCHLCNSPVKKGRKDTIIQRESNYKNCIFNIVHPYFDDPIDHFEFSLNEDENGIIFKPLTLKGKKSVDIFKLNDEAHITARGEQCVVKFLKAKDPESYSEILIQSILEYKSNI